MTSRPRRPSRRAHITAVSLLSALAALLIPGLGSAQAATVTISPLPGTTTALPKTQISFLGAPAGELEGISVVGSSSGKHAGRVKSYVSATGASFLPKKAFTPGEHVTVHAALKTKKGSRSLSTSFTVATVKPVATAEFPPVTGTPADVQNFKSEPQLHPATVTIDHAATTGASPGYVFASPALGPGQYGPMIFDNSGQLVWFRSLAAGDDATDFRIQKYKGKSDLTWWQGRTLQFGYGLGVDVIADSHYKTVATTKAGNGLEADEHEFTVTPKGTARILAYSPVAADLSSVGSFASGIAEDGVIQEIDIKTGLVMWEWHSIGHVALTESYSKGPGLITNPYDYFHINSLDTDKAGNFLISARNTWTVYQVNHHTGQIAWRLGGKKSSFTLGAGVPFAAQHNAVWLSNGDISIFDDEGAPPVNPPSRGIIVKLNLATHAATLSAQFVHTPKGLVTGSQGNTQSLADGNWMIGWGGLPNMTEFNSNGQVTFDAHFPAGENSYRTYRLPWSGQPTTKPALAATTAGGSTTVYASWNGATAVASWQLLAGASASQLTVLSTTPRSGFETAIATPAAAFVQVRALSSAGKVLGTSKTIAPAAG